MMKNLLGIDYGRRKVGVSVASSQIVEPLVVIHYKDRSSLMVRLLRIIEEHKIDEIVIGLSEGEMAQETKKFGDQLVGKFGLPVRYSDETLSSQDAQALSIKAGINRKKRAAMEDAYASAVMLQGFIDNRH